MSILIEALENRLAYSKHLHKEGEITQKEYFKKLMPPEVYFLNYILVNLFTASSIIRSPLKVLAVGSSTDLTNNYEDIDLLACLQDATLRSLFLEQSWRTLRKNSILRSFRITFSEETSVVSKIFLPTKIFIKPISIDRQYDIVFLDPNGGTNQDILAFHQQNKLSFRSLQLAQQ